MYEICRRLDISLHFSDSHVLDVGGNPILGQADFSRRAIVINTHSIETRERFTIAHEIGHFVLGHERYLCSDTVIEQDIFILEEKKLHFNYKRLEFQANAFASELILPNAYLLPKIYELRKELNIRDRGHGYIYVDDQAENRNIYNEFISGISTYFSVSKEVIEIKLIELNFLTDKRSKNEFASISNLVYDIIPPRRS
uniref:ImmA/IrrE family metallo-endopeptidase n=1 Tax=Aquibium sp. A9E412 TaxID=2976767 RepID=UPI00339D95A7